MQGLGRQRGMAFTRSRPALISAFTKRDSSRSFSQCPPLYAFLDVVALPSGVRGPVACCHGFQVRISAAYKCCARASNSMPCGSPLNSSFRRLFCFIACVLPAFIALVAAPVQVPFEFPPQQEKFRAWASERCRHWAPVGIR